MEQTNINSNLEIGKKLLNEVEKRSKPLSLNEINKQAYDRLKARESVSYKDLAEYEFNKLDEKAKSQTSFEVFADSFKNSLNVSNLPYVGNVVDGMNFQKLNDITLKAYKGQALNQEEVTMYDKYVNELKKDKVYQGRNSYAIGSGIVPSIKYSAEYALNTAVVGYATGGVGIVAGSLATALEPTRLYREYQTRQLKGDLNITDKGEVFFGELEKDPVKTILKSYAKSFASDFSEKLGDKLFDNAITSRISSSLTGFKKKIFDVLVGSAQKSNKGGFTGNVLNSIQSTFNGVLGENIEEYIEEPLSQLLGANDNEYTVENLLKSLEVPSLDELLVTNGVLVFQGGISKASYSMANRLAKNGATQEQVEQYVNNTTEEQFEKDIKRLNQADKEQLKNIVNKYTEQLKDGGMNEQEVEANNVLLDKILTYGYTNLNPDELSVDEYYSKNLMFELQKKESIKEQKDIYNQEGQSNIKGQYDPIKRLITLSEISDASTFQHEVMHWWRQFLGEQASGGNSLAQQDLNTLNTFVGAENNNWNTTQQETFARAWEQYLRRGIAPNRELKSTFEKLRDWFTTIYNSFKDINVNGKAITLSKDIIDYFDTILSDEVLNQDLEYEKEKLQQEIEQENQELLNQEVSQEEIKTILEDKYGERLKKIEEQITKSKETTEEEFASYKKSIKEFNDNKLKNSATDFRKKTFNYLSNIFFSENQKIREQSESIYQRYLQSDFAKKKGKIDIEKQTENFVNKSTELLKSNKEDYEKMSIAWYKNDLQTIAELSTKHGIYEDFLKVRDALEQLYYKQLEVGIDVPYRENYLPTRIKSGNFDKVMAIIESKVNTEVFNDINNKILELGLTDETTKLAFVNNYLRGFVPNSILLSPTNFTKRRTLERSAEFYPYYDDFLNSFVSYVSATINNIEDRKLFGKGTKEQQENITDLKRKQKSLLELEQASAGKIKKNEIYRLEFEKKSAELKLKEYKALLTSGKEVINKKDGTTLNLNEEVKNLEEKINTLNENLKFVESASPFVILNNRKKQVKEEIEGIKELLKDNENLENSIANFIIKETSLNNEQQKQLVDLLKSLFNKKATGKLTQTTNTLAGIYVLSNFKSAFKQLNELANSIYKNGFGNTISGLFNQQINMEDIGLDGRWDLESESVLNKIYDKSLKVVGFDKFDMIGKNTFINASLLKSQKLALENNIEFNKKLEVMFQEKAEAVKEDFKNKTISYDVLSYIFSEVNNIQPITDGAKTKFYNDNPSIRFAYNLKSYMVQQLSLVKNDIINEALKGNYKTATRNAFYLQTALWLTGIPISYISHFLFDDDDEEFTITDAMVDNIILNNIVNRFNMARVASGKVLDIFKSVVTPAIFRPLQNILDDLFGIFSGNFENKTIKRTGIIKNIPNKVKPEFLKE